MNTDLINSLKLTGMGMAAIFIVILVIYLAVHLILKLSNNKKAAKDDKRQAESGNGNN